MTGLYISALIIVIVAAAILFGRRSRSTLLNSWLKLVASSFAANIVPLGYCALMAFFLALFERKVLASYAQFSIGHKWFIRICYTLPFVTIARLYFSDPGHITKYNWNSVGWASPRYFEYDRILYLPDQECRTCLFVKPARSKHCSVCNKCVAMQDHHCIFVNNCVGLLNFRWFVLFLLANIYVLSYGSLLLLAALWRDIKTAHGGDPDRFVLWGLIARGDSQRTGACLLILCVCLLPLVVLFLMFHLRYVWGGVTTNEADKWEDIAALVPEQVLYTYPGTSILLLKYPNGTFNRALTAEEHQMIGNKEPVLVTRNEEIPNIYDRGFMNNLKLALHID